MSGTSALYRTAPPVSLFEGPSCSSFGGEVQPLSQRAQKPEECLLWPCPG